VSFFYDDAWEYERSSMHSELQQLDLTLKIIRSYKGEIHDGGWKGEANDRERVMVNMVYPNSHLELGFYNF